MMYNIGVTTYCIKWSLELINSKKKSIKMESEMNDFSIFVF